MSRAYGARRNQPVTAAVAAAGGYANIVVMDSETTRPAGIYDQNGTWLAPLEGNELPTVPEKRCPHGRLCAACAKR